MTILVCCQEAANNLQNKRLRSFNQGKSGRKVEVGNKRIIWNWTTYKIRYFLTYRCSIFSYSVVAFHTQSEKSNMKFKRFFNLLLHRVKTLKIAQAASKYLEKLYMIFV